MNYRTTLSHCLLAIFTLLAALPRLGTAVIAAGTIFSRCASTFIAGRMIWLIVLCSFLLFTSGTPQAAITYVNSLGTANAKGASSTTTTFTVGATGASVGNNVIISFVAGFSAGEELTVPTCADTKGNTYTTDIDFYNQATVASRTTICSSRLTAALTTGDVITVTHASQPARALSVNEFSGLAAASVLDKTAGAFGSSTSASSGFTATTTQADELVFGAVGVRGPVSQTYTKGATYTALPRDGTTGSSDTGNRTINPEYKIVSATGTYAADGTLGTSTSWIAVVATYKAAAVTTTLGNGTALANSNIAPSGAATNAGAFSFQTSSGTDTITAATVTLAAGTSGGLSLVEITNIAGTTVYGSVTNPASDTPAIALTTNITATTTLTEYRIRVTPRTHANMPAPAGSSYAVTARVSAWTGTNTQAGSDTAGTTVTIDNLSPGNVTASTATAGNAQVALSWTNPADADLHSIIVLRRATSAVADVPVEGTTYVVGNTIGTSTVACVVAVAGTSCTDTGLTNGTAYNYKVFAKDSNGNYSATGVVPSSSPATPSLCPGNVVTTTADTGANSLRECINAANSSPGTTISFNIPGPGNQSAGADSWWRISPASTLPVITASGTVIDGTTQNTNQGNTNTMGPEIELSGTSAGVVNGLWATSANNTIKGLIINGYNGAGMAGIRIDGAGATGNAVSGNYIGTDYSGTTAAPNNYGVSILGGAQSNAIGGAGGATTRNIISGNMSVGVYISGAGTSLNTVIGNYIGTNTAGGAALANIGGITLNSSATNNDIGGQNAGEGNVISGNGSGGIFVGAGGNRIRGNKIGTNAAGSAKVANTGDGIKVNGADGLTIGGSAAGAGNIISGNGGDGIDLTDWTRNVDIYGNTIGSGVTATETTLGNTGPGLFINSFYAPSNYNIGGTASGQGNVIANNGNRGIYYQSGTSAVLGNYIGTNSGGTPLANSGDAIYINGGTINLGNAAEVQSNIIGPASGGVGINLLGSGTINLAGTVTVNSSVTLSGGTLSMGSATLNVSDYWTRTATTVTPGTSTVNFNGIYSRTITSGGASFYNLTINKTGASGNDKVSIVGALDVNGTLTITDGVLDISNTAPANNATVNTAGNVTIGAAGSVNVTGRTASWTFDGTSILTDSSSGGPQQFNDVIVNGTSLTLGSAAKMKTLTVTAGTMNLGASGYILELTGTGTPLSNSGTFTAGTSTVKYTGTTTATNIATVPYSSLWLAPTAATTYSLTGHLTGGNAMTGNLTIDTNATLDVVTGSNYNVTTVNVMLNGTYLARVSTINVGGNWNMTNGTFTRGTSTVNFTGTGTITNNNASWWTKSFYNLTAAAAGNTTTFDTTTGGVNIVNILTLGTGTLSGGQALLSKDTGTPLITAGATLSNTAFKYDGSTGPVNVAATTYPELWVAGNNPVNTFNLAGNITCGNLFIYGNGSGNTAVLDTTISNYSINCNLLSVGTSAATTYGTLTLNNSTATINGNATIYASDASGTNQINAGGSTINVSGSWTNNDTFTASTGTVVLNGANQTITGNTTFNNLTKSVATARTLTFTASSTTTITGTITLNGASGQLLSLVSSSPGTRWNFVVNASATKAISYVSVADSDASGSAASQKPISPLYFNDMGTNIDWFAIPTVVKSMTVISDPLNNTTNPKAIPGAIIEYTITIANGTNGSTATNIVVTDSLNANITSGTLAFNPNTYAAGQGVQVTAPNINGGAAQNLTNVADADAGDFNVTGTNTITVSGIALNTGQSATVKFRVTVQ